VNDDILLAQSYMGGYKEVAYDSHLIKAAVEPKGASGYTHDLCPFSLGEKDSPNTAMPHMHSRGISVSDDAH